MFTPAQWQKSGRIISIYGRKIFTKITGTGPPLLLLHGFPTSSYDYIHLIPTLAQTCRIILFDYPGFGFSEKPPKAPYTLHFFADIAAGLLDHLVINQLSILAHDIGDSVAQELLGRTRPKITNLILMNGSIVSSPFEDPKFLLAQKILLTPTAIRLLSKAGLINKSYYLYMLRQAFYKSLTTAEKDAFWTLFKYNNGHKNYPRLIQYMHERTQHEQKWLDNLVNSDIPLTLIWGQEDPIAPPIIASKVQQRLPQTPIHLLPNTAHYPHWESPDTVIPLILQALNQ